MNNLYDDTSKAVVSAKTELYALIDKYQARSTEDVVKAVKASKKASVFWQNAGGYIVPFSNVDEAENYQGVSYGNSFPKLCMR